MIAVIGSLAMSSFACALFLVTVFLGRPPAPTQAARMSSVAAPARAG